MKLEKILKEAVAKDASDIYISTGGKPVYRVRGDLVFLDAHAELTDEEARGYLFDIMSPEQQSEFKERMDLDFSFELPNIARFRANVFLNRNGMGGILRVIPTKIPTLEQMHFPESFKKIPALPNGLVLVTGPTGSGKSTTLAAMINDINTNTDAHIITIEDPIEFVYKNSKSVIDQREVGANTKSFSQALRAALREDPDVILVGEMRDPETIALAITAAETGHLVFATLHTSGAAQSVDRIVSVFPAERQNQIRTELADTLRAVIWQKLFKRADGKGRIAAYEVLFVNTATANLIRENKIHQILTILETGGQEGMQTMQKAILSLLAQNLITREDAVENLPAGLVDGSA